MKSEKLIEELSYNLMECNERLSFYELYFLYGLYNHENILTLEEICEKVIPHKNCSALVRSILDTFVEENVLLYKDGIYTFTKLGVRYMEIMNKKNDGK